MSVVVKSAYDVFDIKFAESSVKYDLHATLFPDDGLRSGELVEISGDSNSGKSLLLLELIARAILPINCGGLERGALLIDCENSFNRSVLLNIMEKHMLNNAEPALVGTLADLRQKKTLQQESLTRLHLITCYSLEQFDLTLLSLPQLFHNHKDIAFVLIDSIATFYWNKCTPTKLVRQDSYLRGHCATLNKLAKTCKKIFLFTKPAHFPSNSGSWREFELTASPSGLLDGSTQASFSGNQMFGSLSSKTSTASTVPIDHRIELSEINNPSPGASGQSTVDEQRFHAFITRMDKQQYVRFYLIDKYGFNWIDQ
ncbi:uncharacterized protein LOC128724985 [Anopheles nili]|uniref:uncharacterized protein LOC128724985 n=1 Tax=Anopheles nili TaxID=185578 RepID=UPI00237BBAEB|nr:uncharacterized protein LOC128724985 [Anopheles nili]